MFYALHAYCQFLKMIEQILQTLKHFHPSISEIFEVTCKLKLEQHDIGNSKTE
jgi:hypothetical protein